MQAKMPTNAKWTFGVMLAVIVVLAFVALSSPDVSFEGYVTEENSQIAIDAAVALAIGPLNEQIVALQTATEEIEFEAEAEAEVSGYLLDELYLGVAFLKDIFSDRELDLFDGEVEFDGEYYDAKETFTLEGFRLLANENDFDGNVYLTVPEEAVSYSLVFESELNTSEIEVDETLSFSFLGKEYEVSSWEGDEITLTSGVSHYLEQGESVEVKGLTVTLVSVYSEKVHVTVGDEERRIYEGDTARINGLEIFVKEIDLQQWVEGYKQATLVIGNDVESELESGDEYAEDSPWEWVINASSNTIGLVLIEDFTEVDEDGDEEFSAIGVGESLCLPEEYVCLRFDGMLEEDSEDYTFELDDRDGLKVRIDGNFISGVEDYNRVYVNTTGIYDRDSVLINKNTIELGDTDSELVINATHLTIEDFNVNYALTESNVGDDDEDYLTNYGISVVNPEDSAKDNEYSISVPREQLEGTVSLI